MTVVTTHESEPGSIGKVSDAFVSFTMPSKQDLDKSLDSLNLADLEVTKISNKAVRLVLSDIEGLADQEIDGARLIGSIDTSISEHFMADVDDAGSQRARQETLRMRNKAVPKFVNALGLDENRMFFARTAMANLGIIEVPEEV